MSTETCTVLVDLPNGIVAEGGYSIDIATGGAMVKHPNYFRIELNGWNRNLIKLAVEHKMQPTARKAEPGITTGVNLEQITDWMKRHPRLVKTYNIQVLRDVKSANDAAKDLVKEFSPFEPVNTKGDRRIPRSISTQNTSPIETADFDPNKGKL